jgi:hypothetical protein
MSTLNEFRVLSPTAILGYGFPESSFKRGIERQPHLIAVDAGSTDPGLALHMGKILECDAIAATPGSGADCALGILKADSFILEALSPKRKFTCESAAAHTLYEKTDPYHLPGPGGMIDLENCSFTDIGDGRVEVKGSRFVPSEKYMIKLEGVRPGC